LIKPSSNVGSDLTGCCFLFPTGSFFTSAGIEVIISLISRSRENSFGRNAVQLEKNNIRDKIVMRNMIAKFITLRNDHEVFF